MRERRAKGWGAILAPFQTATDNKEDKSFGVQRIVGQPVEAFVLHAGTSRAKYPSKEEGETDASVAARKIANASGSLIVVAEGGLPADAANRFFRQRLSETTTAIGSPKTPRMCWLGMNPGNRYRSRSCLNLAMRES